jgi:two-component system sensor histidine kinase UhpB
MLSQQDGRVALSVRDDGCGLPERIEEGVGISGMRERALLIDATLELHGAPGQGTEVRLVLAAPVTEASR